MAVVKAQGYGLGARLVAAAALEAGADGLAVARVREGVRLRDLGVQAPMLLLAAFTPLEADTLVANELTPTVVEEGQLTLLSQAAEHVGRQVPVHVKLDTGIRRYGAPAHEAIPVAASVVRVEPSLEGFYTHFATADAPDLGFAREQLAAFQTACGRLEAQGIDRGTCMPRTAPAPSPCARRTTTWCGWAWGFTATTPRRPSRAAWPSSRR